ncbi:hypothetical protein, partial [Escherichia coli]|uniref:hypothetical protein n=1 Tax=Escherichia coli TaxID=562 RepID=UPI001BB48693
PHFPLTPGSGTKTCCIVIKVEPCRHVHTPRAGYLTPDHCLVTRSIALHSVGRGEGMNEV